MNEIPNFMTTGEVATLLGCSRQWVNQLISRSMLRASRHASGGWRRVNAEEVKRYISENDMDVDWSVLEPAETEIDPAETAVRV